MDNEENRESRITVDVLIGDGYFEHITESIENYLNETTKTFSSIRHGGFFDRHPIFVPASIFFICWIPYLIIFLRKSIAFGALEGAYPIDGTVYWIFFAIQLGVCVISHSLTIRTIVRLYAPKWLIWGSITFYALSPAWGLMTTADIRHPLFAAVFCVFTSSCTFALYSKKVTKWLWVQLAGGALCVCLLRSTGIWIILPTLTLIFIFKFVQWWKIDDTPPVSGRIASHFKHLSAMKGNVHKQEESLWGDVCAAFLILSAVGLLFLFSYCVGWALPLGEPNYGSSSSLSTSVHPLAFPFANLTGTEDVGGIIAFTTIVENSVFAEIANNAAQVIFAFQCFPIENITFSWVAYLVLFGSFLVFAIAVSFGWRPEFWCSHVNTPINTRVFDFRCLIIGFSMIIIIAIMAFTPADATLRYLMPVLAAQPMFFGSIFASLKD